MEKTLFGVHAAQDYFFGFLLVKTFSCLNDAVSFAQSYFKSTGKVCYIVDEASCAVVSIVKG